MGNGCNSEGKMRREKELATLPHNLVGLYSPSLVRCAPKLASSEGLNLTALMLFTIYGIDAFRDHKFADQKIFSYD